MDCRAARTSANSASGWLTMVATMMPLMISDHAVFQQIQNTGQPPFFLSHAPS